MDTLPNLPPLRDVATMNERIARQTAQRRLNMLVLGLFGILGLVISAAGVYGLKAYIVSQRSREIGVRIALGATRWEVIGMVLRHAGILVGSGVIIGSLGAWYLGTAVHAFLFGLEPHDPQAFFAAAITLSAAALIASIAPASREASVDPTIALRAE